ncbi:hypothetical protein CRG98_013434 [Punica granatum]|uniref:Uncharacterized protein n=1 Tax=Punica granatum TaxID=22663 RepID=A0A2I0KCA8_PUNGR|nr:hypothetical protein CRG98_013434 [Punica granatum]
MEPLRRLRNLGFTSDPNIYSGAFISFARLSTEESMERNVSDQDKICPSYVMGVISHGRLLLHRCFLRALAASTADLEDSSTKSVWIPVEASRVGRSVDSLKDSRPRETSRGDSDGFVKRKYTLLVSVD